MLFCLSILPLIFCPFARAQGEGAGNAEASTLEDAFQFTARAFGDELFEGIFYSNVDDEEVALSFDPRYRTPVQRLERGVKEIAFYKRLRDESGRETEEAVAFADLKGIESRALLIFLAKRDSDRNLPYTVIVADESPGVFEGGDVRFLNLAGAQLVGRLGERSFPLDFGFGPKLEFDAETIQEMPIELAVLVQEKWKIVYSTGFRPHPEYGTLVLIKPPERLDSIRVKVELRRQRVYAE